MKKIITILVLILSIFPFFSSAQFEFPNSQNALTIKISPEFPAPGSLVNAELTSLNFDLSKALITWAVNGKRVASGTGEKKISFVAANRGSSNIVSATAVSSGETFSTTVTVRPQKIDFLVESKSAIPNWYKGAPLPAQGSKVIVTALPDFVSGSARINPANLFYEWRVDNKIRKELSGKGKQTISFVHGGQGFPKQLELKVTSSDGTLGSKAFYTIDGHAQEILFYEIDSNGTNYARAIRTKNMSENDGVRIRAVPFFMPLSSFSDLGFSWTQNGSKVSSLNGEPDVLEIKTEANTKGQSSTFGVTIQMLSNLLQKIGNSFNVQVR